MHLSKDQLTSYTYRGFKFLIRASLLVAIFSAILKLHWIVLFISLVAFFLTFLPYYVGKSYKIRVPVELELAVVVFIYASLFLGEVQGYYVKFWWWDVVLHTSSGLALAIIGFLILYYLDESGRIKAQPIWIAVFTFAFAVAIGAVWEIFEFTMDQVFLTNMQKSGLVDTMWDLIVDSLGALVAAILGYFYMKTKKAPLLDRFVDRFVRANERLFKK